MSQTIGEVKVLWVLQCQGCS